MSGLLRQSPVPACDSHVQQVCLWLPAQQAHGGLLLPSFEPPWLPIDLGVNAVTLFLACWQHFALLLCQL